MLTKKERDKRTGIVFRLFGFCIFSERRLSNYIEHSKKENRGFCKVMSKKKNGNSVDYCRGYEAGNDNVYTWLLRTIKK